MEKILNEILSTLKDHSKRFDSIDERFISIGGDLSVVKIRLGNVEDKLVSFEGKLISVEDRLVNVDGKLVSVEDRLVSVEDRVRALSEQVDNNAAEFRSHFKHIETALEQHEETFHLISDTLIGTSIDIDHLSKKSGLHDTENNQLKKRIHS